MSDEAREHSSLSHYVHGISKVQKDRKGWDRFYTSWGVCLPVSFCLPGVLKPEMWTLKPHFSCLWGPLFHLCTHFPFSFYLFSPKQFTPDLCSVRSHLCSRSQDEAKEAGSSDVLPWHSPAAVGSLVHYVHIWYSHPVVPYLGLSPVPCSMHAEVSWMVQGLNTPLGNAQPQRDVCQGRSTWSQRNNPNVHFANFLRGSSTGVKLGCP